MSDLKLFRLNGDMVSELSVRSVSIEKSLQSLIEKHLDAFLGVRFLASEYSTGKTHGGRVDTLGIDENGCPVIIEYKRATSENVINQGLFYLDWLLDHRGEFNLLVQDRMGRDTREKVEWSSPRLVCIAGDFTKYDENAVQQINRNIELIRYRRYGEDLVLLELVNATTANQGEYTVVEPSVGGAKMPQSYKTVSEYLEDASEELRDRYEALKAFLLGLGDDVQFKVLKFYFAFKRIKNFACVEIKPQLGVLTVHAKVNPDEVELEEGFTRDVRNVGHFGTGDLEITIRTDNDLKKAEDLLVRSYEES